MTESFKERARIEWLTTLVSLVFGFHSASAVAEKKSSAPVRATGQSQYEIAIPRIGITEALHVFSDQTGLNIGWFPDNEEQELILVGPVEGRYSAEYALAQLLAETGLEFDWLNERSLYLFSPKQEAPREAHREEPKSSRRPVESGTVIVIASRMSVDAHPPPTVDVDRQTIESYGASTLAEVLQYLPQMPYMRAAGSRVSGEQYADLRGFGPGTTLILINGRRVGASATSFDSSAFDLNAIPLTAVKQIEIYLDEHSVAYGADGMGGVMNIVLKDEFPEPLVQLKYGAAQGGADEIRGSVGFGTSNERFRGAVTLDYFHRDFLFGSERELTSNQDFRRFGKLDMRSIDASPPNISSLTGGNLPGLTSPFAAVPPDSDGMPISELHAGQRNLVSASQFQSIVPKARRASGVGNLRMQLADDVELFSEALFVDREDVFQFGPPVVRGIISAENPFNPFGEGVAVNALVIGADATTYVTETSLFRGVLGAHAAIDEWTVEAFSVWYEEDAYTWRGNELDASKVAQALSTTEADKALNFFRDGSPGSSGLLHSLRADRVVDHFESEYVHAQFNLKGPLLDVPAGQLRLLLGSEWRREGLSTPPLPIQAAVRSQRTTAATFGEVSLPVVSADMGVPLAKAIDVTLGLRGDHGDFGREVTAQYSAVWQPMSPMKVRLYYRDFYRQPNLYDLYSPHISVATLQLPDPRRNYELSPVAVIAGGNASLTPITGRGLGIRFEHAPSVSMRFSAGYWRTDIRDRIAYLPFTFALSHESQFPDLVVRAAPSPQDVLLGMSGALVRVHVLPGNYGNLQADGADFAIKNSLGTRFGRFTSTLTATWNHSYTTTFAPGLKPEQRVGIANDAGTIPRWRGVVSAGLEKGLWSFFCAARFVSEYDDTSLEGARNGRSIPASIQLDAQASVNFTKALQGLRLTIGAANLLDAAPNYSESFGASGYDHTQADLRQRFFYLGAEKSF